MAKLLKVSSKSNPKSVAGAIANMVRDGEDTLEAKVIGAGSLNQLCKAVAIARGFVAPTGKDLAMVPSFTEVLIEEEEKTALLFRINVTN